MKRLQRHDGSQRALQRWTARMCKQLIEQFIRTEIIDPLMTGEVTEAMRGCTVTLKPEPTVYDFQPKPTGIAMHFGMKPVLVHGEKAFF